MFMSTFYCPNTMIVISWSFINRVHACASVRVYMCVCVHVRQMENTKLISAKMLHKITLQLSISILQTRSYGYVLVVLCGQTHITIYNAVLYVVSIHSIIKIHIN